MVRSSFCSQLFKENRPLLEKIYKHPFIQELADGTLSKERFCNYIQQDSHYLIHFARALAITASRSLHEQRIETLLLLSRNVLLAERSLHFYYFREFNVSPNARPNLACNAYYSYLLATVSLDSMEEGLGALLACFWIYREVGRHLSENLVPFNPYAKWIGTYSDEDFSRNVDRFIALIDDVAAKTDENTRQLMKKAFTTSSYFEWHFWDEAYHMRCFEDIG